MTTSLIPPTTEYLPADELLDKAHPANSAYLQSIDRLKRAIVQASSDMYPLHVRIAKESQNGHSYSEIGRRLDIHPTTVSNTLKKPKTKRLVELLGYLRMAQDGPQEAQRKHFLWRIALDNQTVDPRVAIAATAEINRMNHNRELFDSGNAGSGKVEIVINGGLLPRTELDA